MGVDNVDVDAATRRGVVVANAPQSNVITAAEHTMALLLALARNVPQAHASLVGGAWERARFSGVELHEKVLGIIGFGRIGQLVAHRARGFGMRVIAYDAYLAEERFRELGVERAGTPDEVYAVADFITLHLPKNSETEGWLNAAAIAKMKDGVRILNVARGPLVVDADLEAALDSGKVAGAALDVFHTEPVTDHPLFGYPNVVVTPHLGASTAEATDRAGYQAAEQLVAALTGGAVTSAVNVPAIAADDLEAVGPFLGLCVSLGRIAGALAPGTSVDALEVEYLGRIAERDSRLLTIQVVKGLLAGHTEQPVNDVNAATVAHERGIAIAERNSPEARDFTDLVRVRLRSGSELTRVVGTVLGRRNRPHLLEAWGSRFNVQLEQHLAVFRYRDQPGMLGRVGTALGAAGVNIVSAAVGHRPDDGRRRGGHDRHHRHAGPGLGARRAGGRGRFLRRARRQFVGVRPWRSVSARPDRPDLEDALSGHRVCRRNLDRLGHVAALQQVEAGEHFLRLQERTIGHQHLAVADPHHGRLLLRGDPVTGDPQPPSVHRRDPVVDVSYGRGRWFDRHRVNAHEHQELHGFGSFCLLVYTVPTNGSRLNRPRTGRFARPSRRIESDVLGPWTIDPRTKPRVAVLDRTVHPQLGTGGLDSLHGRRVPASDLGRDIADVLGVSEHRHRVRIVGIRRFAHQPEEVRADAGAP